MSNPPRKLRQKHSHREKDPVVKRKRVKKSRLTPEDKIKSAIQKALRTIWWRRDHNRRGKIKQSTIQKGIFRCDGCQKEFEKIEIDHVVPVGSLDNWSSYISRLFVPVDGLQALCRTCHQKKTNKESGEKRNLKSASKEKVKKG